MLLIFPIYQHINFLFSPFINTYASYFPHLSAHKLLIFPIYQHINFLFSPFINTYASYFLHLSTHMLLIFPIYQHRSFLFPQRPTPTKSQVLYKKIQPGTRILSYLHLEQVSWPSQRYQHTDKPGKAFSKTMAVKRLDF